MLKALIHDIIVEAGILKCILAHLCCLLLCGFNSLGFVLVNFLEFSLHLSGFQVKGRVEIGDQRRHQTRHVQGNHPNDHFLRLDKLRLFPECLRPIKHTRELHNNTQTKHYVLVVGQIDHVFACDYEVCQIAEPPHTVVIVLLWLLSG